MRSEVFTASSASHDISEPAATGVTRPPMWSIYLNVAVQGVLTGLVYGLMALGLSVIFGIVRVVNFAHGEFAVVAMYAALLLFRGLGLDPLAAMLPVAAVFFGIGYLLQRALINPFVGRAEHE